MAITQVSGQATGTQRSGLSSAALTLTYANPTTTGDLLICIISGFNTPSNTYTVTDNKGNTWQQAVAVLSNQTYSQIWYCPNATGGSGHQVTVTPSQSSFLSIAIDEFSGAATSLPLDKTNSASANGAPGESISSGSVVTTTDGELYVAACSTGAGGASTLTPTGSGWTNVYTQASTSSTEAISYLYRVSVQGTYSEAWPPRKEIGDGHPLLIESGKLFLAATSDFGEGHIGEVRDRDAVTGIDPGEVKYAAAQNFGREEINLPAREFEDVDDATIDQMQEIVADEALELLL